jgi:long-chain acyl-CoA synthetase
VVLAFVALRPGHTASADDLIAFSKQHLAEYKCPEQILFLPVLPKGATGKVQRRALKDLRSAAAAS